jgi:hypothetical protein
MEPIIASKDDDLCFPTKKIVEIYASRFEVEMKPLTILFGGPQETSKIRKTAWCRTFENMASNFLALSGKQSGWFGWFVFQPKTFQKPLPTSSTQCRYFVAFIEEEPVNY